ncbi:MAG TPA: hypothetical protein VK660_05825 [Xanthomonadaceae bacterium]|jgi:hypothetical protein|nr:hypothetical protein [Xanthomonadaceae bacterium]
MNRTPDPKTVKNVCGLIDAIIDTIDTFSVQHRDTPLEIGEALSALFTVMMHTARSSPAFDLDDFAEAFNENIRNANVYSRPCDA